MCLGGVEVVVERQIGERDRDGDGKERERETARAGNLWKILGAKGNEGVWEGESKERREGGLGMTWKTEEYPEGSFIMRILTNSPGMKTAMPAISEKPAAIICPRPCSLSAVFLPLERARMWLTVVLMG